MAFNPDIRASDADRDRVAAELREHCAQGRIAVEELDERLDAVYHARTLGELQKITSDLPEQDLYELPVPAWRSSTPAHRPFGGDLRSWIRGGWAVYVVVNLICIVTWLAVALPSGAWYPWWIWVAGPWGAALLGGQLFRRDRG